MHIEMLFSKIHRATVTDADVEYVGSITVDETLIKKANLKLYQKVDIYDVTNGERFSTYVIKGEPNSGKICLNGAAALKVSVGDKIIIASYASMTPEEAENFTPTAILVDEKNRFVKEL